MSNTRSRSTTGISLTSTLGSVSDEVNLWLLWSTGSWFADLDVGGVVSLLEENIDQVLVLILFWEDDFGLLGRRGRWSLDEDDVDVLVSSGNLDGTGLSVFWLIGGGVDVNVTEDLWGVGWGAVFGVTR